MKIHDFTTVLSGWINIMLKGLLAQSKNCYICYVLFILQARQSIKNWSNSLIEPKTLHMLDMQFKTLPFSFPVQVVYVLSIKFSFPCKIYLHKYYLKRQDLNGEHFLSVLYPVS